jgi:PAS domain S-box-containing protein
MGIVSEYTTLSTGSDSMVTEASFSLLGAIVDQIPDPVLVKDQAHRWVFMNEAHCRFSGFKAEDVIGKSDYDFFPREEADVFWAHDDEVFRTGKLDVNEEYHTDANGKRHIVLTKKSLYRSPEGELYVVGIFQNVTELREQEIEIARLNLELARQYQIALQNTEEALITTESKLQQIVDSNLVGIISWHPDGRIMDANQAFLDMTGYTREDLVSGGVNWRGMVVENEQFLSDSTNLQQLFDTGSPKPIEVKFPTKAGHPIDLYIALAFLNTNPEEGVGVVADISQLKQTEHALQQSDTRWRDLANAVPFIIWVANAEGSTVFWNDRWYKYSGLTVEQSLGSTIINAVYPEEREAFAKRWAEHVESGELFETEVRYRAADGSYRWHLVRAVPIQDGDGAIKSWYGSLIDIQERRLMEMELETAKDVAEEANQKKSQFLANMSHELRTPLNAVIGFSDMLRRGMGGTLTEKQSTYMDYINASGRHLLAMVNDILDISKAEAGKITLALRSIEINPFVEELKGLISFSTYKHQVKLSFVIQPELQTMIADPDRLRQIFINLISNAIKFNHEGGAVNVELSCSTDGQWFFGKVQDTGIGIPSDQLPLLFNEFYQVDSSSTRLYEGAGLGLALTRKLVELHQGRIYAESQEGVGSTFTFQLPMSHPVI